MSEQQAQGADAVVDLNNEAENPPREAGSAARAGRAVPERFSS